MVESSQTCFAHLSDKSIVPSALNKSRQARKSATHLSSATSWLANFAIHASAAPVVRARRLVSQMSNPDLQGNLRHERLDGNLRHDRLELVHFGEDEASAKQHIFKWSPQSSPNEKKVEFCFYGNFSRLCRQCFRSRKRRSAGTTESGIMHVYWKSDNNEPRNHRLTSLQVNAAA